MKKFLSILLVLSMFLSLSACGGKKTDSMAENLGADPEELEEFRQAAQEEMGQGEAQNAPADPKLELLQPLVGTWKAVSLDPIHENGSTGTTVGSLKISEDGTILRIWEDGREEKRYYSIEDGRCIISAGMGRYPELMEKNGVEYLGVSQEKGYNGELPVMFVREEEYDEVITRIPITPENAEQYFELVQGKDIFNDNFGDMEQGNVTYDFCLKEEYVPCFALSEVVLDVSMEVEDRDIENGDSADFRVLDSITHPNPESYAINREVHIFTISMLSRVQEHESNTADGTVHGNLDKGDIRHQNELCWANVVVSHEVQRATGELVFIGQVPQP